MSYYLCAVLICTFNYLITYVVGNDQTLNDILFSGRYEFIDLTYPFDKNTIYWPNNQKFSFTRKVGAFGKDGLWYAANDFTAGEHGGTHIDAPYHFYVNGIRAGAIPLDKLIAPLIIVDISSKVNDDPKFVLQKYHLDYMLNDNFGNPCVIVFKFGWSKFFYNNNKYLGMQPNGTLSFPGLSAEVAEWITSSYKNVVGIGVDTASVDPGSSTDFPVHKIISRAGLYIIENAKLDMSVPDWGCTALSLPMKIALGSGAPLRLVAICPKQTPTHFKK